MSSNQFMDDDDDDLDVRIPQSVANQSQIRFGSLESQAAAIARLPSPMQVEQATSAAPAPTPLTLSEESQEAMERKERLMKELEIKHRSRTIAVPTDDMQVRGKLRELHEPITLFGERAYERRERLKALLARLSVEEGVTIVEAGAVVPPPTAMEEEKEKQPELFFTEGTNQLREARLFIAQYSLPRAAQRIAEQKRRAAEMDLDAEEESQRKRAHEKLAQYELSGSQIGDDKPVNCICVSPSGEHVITASWGGSIKSWSLKTGEMKERYRGHKERATGLAFSPIFTGDVDADNNNNHSKTLAFASGSADNAAKLWAWGDVNNPIATLEGHTDRLGRIAFHPSGRFLGTTSFDGTWRFWDLPTATCLLEQEGHAKSVYGIAFQIDGSLCATCDIGGIIRVWDLRTGRTVLPLQGHVKEVLSVDFAPNGYQLASASDDHTARIWDLRKKKSVYTIPAHSKLISHVKYEPEHGNFLITASYDNTCKVWDSVEYKLIKTLAGHESRVMCADISHGGDYIVSSSFDRTWKWYSLPTEKFDDTTTSY